MSITELLKALEEKHAETVLKADARAAAAKALDEADKAWQVVAAELGALRDETSKLIGELLPQSDPRFRKSA